VATFEPVRRLAKQMDVSQPTIKMIQTTLEQRLKENSHLF